MDADAKERIAKSTQEQAVAAWTHWLNEEVQKKVDAMLAEQDGNLEKALAEMQELKKFVSNPEHILGAVQTKHGEVAEHVQVNVSNARNYMKGLTAEYTFEGVGRTAPEDYLKNGAQIQSKFYNGAKHTMEAVKGHLDKYPDFVKNGGSYDIPQDQYNAIVRVLNLQKENPSSLSKEQWRLAEAAKQFQQDTGLNFGRDVSPTIADYSDVQLGKIDDTIRKEEQSLHKTDQEKRAEIYEQGKPNFKQGAQAAGVGAVLEGGMAFCLEIARKCKEGKKLQNFTEEDWCEIGKKTGYGTVKGGIRGAAVYLLSNFTVTPENVASAYVTAVFGVGEQLNAYRTGKITKEDFLINSETLCLDVTVSAIASIVGQTVIPVPILGALVGNVAGEYVYEICKQYNAEKEQELVSTYRLQMEELGTEINLRCIAFANEAMKKTKEFESLVDIAFDEDVNIAFEGAIKLAQSAGVKEEKILKTKADIDAYFLN